MAPKKMQFPQGWAVEAGMRWDEGGGRWQNPTKGAPGPEGGMGEADRWRGRGEEGGRTGGGGGGGGRGGGPVGGLAVSASGSALDFPLVGRRLLPSDLRAGGSWRGGSTNLRRHHRGGAGVGKG